MVVWDLMACPFFEPSGTTTIATVKVAMMGHPDHGSVSGGDGGGSPNALKILSAFLGLRASLVLFYGLGQFFYDFL